MRHYFNEGLPGAKDMRIGCSGMASSWRRRFAVQLGVLECLGQRLDRLWRIVEAGRRCVLWR